MVKSNYKAGYDVKFRCPKHQTVQFNSVESKILLYEPFDGAIINIMLFL